nr:unnamed protein product [Naegleria fowleri]
MQSSHPSLAETPPPHTQPFPSADDDDEFHSNAFNPFAMNNNNNLNDSINPLNNGLHEEASSFRFDLNDTPSTTTTTPLPINNNNKTTTTTTTMNPSITTASLVLNNKKLLDYCHPAAWLSFLVVLVVFLAISGACLMYPVLYLRDFSSEKTIVESTSITLKPYYVLFWQFYKGYTPPFLQATRKIQVPANARFMLYSFTSNASVETMVFRNTKEYYHSLMKATDDMIWKGNLNETNFLLEYPLERSFFSISENTFASRLFATRIVNDTTGESQQQGC